MQYMVIEHYRKRARTPLVCSPNPLVCSPNPLVRSPNPLVSSMDTLIPYARDQHQILGAFGFRKRPRTRT